MLTFLHRSIGATLLVLVGCSSPRARVVSLPPAEFLLNTADSTFWVTTTSGRVSVRGVPLVLARYDGRFYELYTADDDRSYDDALLLGERLYRRDLLTGDSTAIFADTIVPRIADAYARAHPDERPLSPDDDGSAQPSTTATAEVDVLDVTGPYLSYEYHVDLDLPNRRSWHSTRRGVLDLRSGQERAVADVFGAAESQRLTTAGRLAYQTARDSILRARGSLRRDDAGSADALLRLEFDDRSFSLSTLDGQPAVIFSVPGHGEGSAGDVVELDPLEVDSVSWWHTLNDGVPSTDDAGNDRWDGRGYRVLANYDTSGEIAAVSIGVSSKARWPVAGVTAPLRGIYWLDHPAVSPASRAALNRAFNQAATYSEDARIALNSAAANLYLVTNHAADQKRSRKPARNVGADDARARQQHGPRVRRRRAVDDGQVRRHFGVPPQPKQRRHSLD